MTTGRINQVNTHGWVRRKGARGLRVRLKIAQTRVHHRRPDIGRALDARVERRRRGRIRQSTVLRRDIRTRGRCRKVAGRGPETGGSESSRPGGRPPGQRMQATRARGPRGQLVQETQEGVLIGLQPARHRQSEWPAQQANPQSRTY